MAITIKDVAKETNLAISTISKYMNGGNVRIENREVIEEAIRKLGYRPNRAAQGLRSSKTYMVGLVVESMENQFFSLVTEHIERALKAKGYSLLICCHRDRIEKAKKSVDFLTEKQVDGIIIVAVSGEIDYMESARGKDIPVVVLDRIPRGLYYDSVSSNSATGMYCGVEYLVRMGHRNIGIITGTVFGNPCIENGNERLAGYLRVLEDYCLPINNANIKKGDFSFESGYRGLNELMTSKEPPTAIVTSNYNMTLGAVTAIHNLKLKIPEDISFVAFDDLEFSVITNPNLTSIRQPVEEIAWKSVELLLRRIGGDYMGFPQNIKLPTTFHERESVRSLME